MSVLWLSPGGAESPVRSVPVTLNQKRRYDCFLLLLLPYRAKGFQHQRMTNGAMNVEIGNPAYKIYEGEPEDDAGELLDADFTLDPDKVNKTT